MFNFLKLSNDLKLLFLSLVISIAAITSVGFFTAKIEAGFEDSAADLLAADMRINANGAINPAIENEAKNLGLRTANIVEMPTMLMNQEGDMELVGLKAVSENYPLRGEFSTTQLLIPNGANKGQGVSVLSAPATGHTHIPVGNENTPKTGTVYLSKRIAKKLQLAINDEVSLGYKTFVVAAYIDKEPDKVGNVFQFAPKVMINYNDLAETKLISKGSRVHYRLLLAGDKKQLQKMPQIVDPLCTKCRLESVKDARPQLKQTLDKAADFLQLAALVSIILAGAAMVMSVQQYAQKQVKNSVIMRSMGATMNNVLLQEITLLTKITVIATLIGSAIGYGGSLYILHLMGDLIGLQGNALLKPIASGFLTALVMVLGFTLPTLLALKKVPVVAVLQNQASPLSFSGWNVLLASTSALFLILMWNSQDKLLASYLFVFVLLAMGVVYSLVLLTTWLLNKTPWLKQPNFVGVQMGLILFVKRKHKNALQITALSIGVLVVVLLGLLRGDILSIWQSSMSSSTANMFLVNVQEDDIKAIQQTLKDNDIDARFVPLIRARLIKINDREITQDSYESAQAKRIINREFNMSFSDTLPKANSIVEGDWWSKGSAPQLSFEKAIAERLKIKLHDTVSFDIAGQTVSAKVTNIRTLKWQSLDVNFFVMGNNGWLENFPQTWVSSFHLQDHQQGMLNDLITQYSHITALDIKAIMAQIQSIINKVSQALEFVFMFTLASALLVLLAAANATKGERTKEIALQKVMGASRKQISQSILAEYALIAVFAVLPACLFALFISNYLAINVFGLPSVFNLSVLNLYIPPAIILVMLSGWLANKKVLNVLPIQSLKS